MNSLGGLLHFLQQERPHVVGLQEVHLNCDELSDIVGRYNYNAFVSKSVDNRPGIAFLCAKSLTVNDHHILEPGRMSSLCVEDDIVIINLYAPSGSQGRAERRNFFAETLFRNVSTFNFRPIIIGDFNCVLNRIDTLGYFQNKNCPALSDFITTFKYSDTFRVLYPTDIAFTYAKQNSFPSRLDRVYVPANLINTISSLKHVALLSDHKLVSVKLKWTLPSPSPRRRHLYWKLNVNVLKDDDFIFNFERLWLHLVAETGTFPCLPDWWEHCAKPQIRKFLIRYSKVLASYRKQTKSFLFTSLELAIDEGDWEEVAYLRSRIAEILNDELYGFTIRSRDSAHAETERGSLYHANSEMKQAAAGVCEQMKINGEVCNSSEQIEDEITSFFQDLFNGCHRSGPGGVPVNTGQPFIPNYEHIDDFLSNVASMDDDFSRRLDSDISLDELLNAIKMCPTHKSPGSDGLPYEFYQKVKHIIGPFLLTIFNDQLKSESLISSNREGVTRLLNKVQPNTPEINQLRPITLLNCDYKLMSKCVATRLNSALKTTLSSGQLCGREPQNILFGASNILSTLEYINQKDLNAYLVSFDIYKAYDKTSIDFIVKVMKKMNFGPNFISWIKIMHKDVTTKFLLTNLSRCIDVKFSVRQGDPSAMPLFLINIEPLLLMLREHTSGVSVAGVCQQDEDYVDDIELLSSRSSDLFIINNIFTRFEAMSGTVLNRSKSNILGLGGWTGRTDWPLSWLKPVPSLKIFGLQILPTLTDSMIQTWNETVKGLNKCLYAWKSRRLTNLSERIFVINVFAMSKLWYIAQIFPIPKEIVKYIRKIVNRFIWQGRLEKIAMDELYSPIDQGGLALICLEMKCDALLLTQTCRILANDSMYRRHLLYWIAISTRDILNLNSDVNCEIVTPYYKKIVKLLKDGFFHECIDISNLKNVKCKKIYKCFTETPPPPKIVYKWPTFNWDNIFRNFDSKVIFHDAKDVLFSILHNIYPTRERLLRCKLHPNGLCPECNVVENTKHYGV